MLFMRHVYHGEDIFKLNISGFDARMRKPVYKCVLFPVLDVVIRFELGAGGGIVVLKTLYWISLAYSTILRSLKIDSHLLHFPCQYIYGYRLCEVREVFPIHRSERNYPAASPRARDSVNVTNLFNVKLTFDEMKKAGPEWSENVCNTVASALFYKSLVC